MTDPAITVLMPVRDGMPYLADAIASIRAQSLAAFELLVCDDGSVDGTPDLLAQIAAIDPRLRILTLPRAGIVAALNTGLLAARCGWVARMDADDLAHPDRLRRLLDAAQRQPQAAAIGSAWRVIDAGGRPRRIVVPPGEPAAIAAALRDGNCLAHPTMLLRRDAILAAGGYRAVFTGAEDYDLWLRLAERHALRTLPEPLLDYREHAGQTAWAAIEARLVAARGAQLASAARRAGRADPAEGACAIDRTWLRAEGLTDHDIAAWLIAGALGAAQDALAAGQGRPARAALRLLWRQPGLHPRTRLHAAWLLARSLRVDAGHAMAAWKMPSAASGQER